MKAMGIGEPIRILKTSGGTHPLEFAWRGRRHYVRTIEGYRSDVEQRDGKVRERKRYQLITADGLHDKFLAAETPSLPETPGRCGAERSRLPPFKLLGKLPA